MDTDKIFTGKIPSFIVVVVLIGMMTVYIYDSADTRFQNDSESLAVGRIVAEAEGLGIDTQGYGLGRLSPKNDPYHADIYSVLFDDDIDDIGRYYGRGYTYGTYTSQVGLQGHVFAFLARSLPIDDPYILVRCLRLTCCFLFVVVLCGITWQIYKKYGGLFAAVFLAVSMVSRWTVDFSRNLYWVEFIWFLPMFLGLLCLNYPLKRKMIYPFFGLSVFLKCLCGYEYISTIMLSGILFLLLEWQEDKKRRRETFACILSAGAFSLIGFIAAFSLHASVYGKGDFVSGLRLMYVSLIQRRTYGNAVDFSPTIADSLNASVFAVLKKYLWYGTAGKFILLLSILACVCLVYQKRSLKKDIRSETYLYALAFVSSVSWFVLAKAHSYIHTHINFVMYYMGYADLCIHHSQDLV